MIRNKYREAYLTHAVFLWLISGCLVLTSGACAQNATYNLEAHIGLYQLVEKNCTVAKDGFNLCDSTHFIELVKGQFYGIDDSQLALVVWSGDINKDSELEYTAQLIENHTKTEFSDGKIWLTKDKNIEEYFTISNSALKGYTLKTTEPNATGSREIHYQLQPVRRGNMPHVRLNYPGRE